MPRTNIENMATDQPNKCPCTSPSSAASFKASSMFFAIASKLNCATARCRARRPSASRSSAESRSISNIASLHAGAVGSLSHPVLSTAESFEKSGSTILSVGPPLSHASTGRRDIMPSTGIIPKCSLVGVYKSACVDEEVRSHVRCALVKLSKSVTSGSDGGGRVLGVDIGGVT